MDCALLGELWRLWGFSEDLRPQASERDARREDGNDAGSSVCAWCGGCTEGNGTCCWTEGGDGEGDGDGDEEGAAS